jgi:anti-sigma B factor antagonist
MPLYIVEKAVGDVALLDLRGRLTLGPETVALRSKITELLDAGQTRILLNLGEVTYIDSVGLSSLVAGYTSTRKHGGSLKLLHLPRDVRQLLQITRLSTVFEIFENVDAAVQSFQRDSQAGAPAGGSI